MIISIYLLKADLILALADEQYHLGLRFEAMLSFHTVCVFFRVMETMLPPTKDLEQDPNKNSSIQHKKLIYAAGYILYTYRYISIYM